MRPIRGVQLACLLAWLLAGVAWAQEQTTTSGPTPADVFELRIMPIFRSPKPASCVQCHLAGVDLKDYILPSSEQTFASLRDQGLIDLKDPAKSKILTLIQMGEEDRDEGARLIHEKARQAEYEAFAAWIAACSNDPKLRSLPALPADVLARPERPDEVIRHARKSRVIDSFVRNVWSQRMRCFPCHTPHELDESNPQHRIAIQRHKEFMEKLGAQYAERMDIFQATPEATLQRLIEKSRTPPEGTLPLLNLAEPTKSLLVLKPTAKVPVKNEDGSFAPASSAEPVSHVGGLKMHVDDPSYKSFVAWIQDYARVVGDRYTSVDDLPQDNWYASKHVIMVREVPAKWTENTRVQLFVHAWDAKRSRWSEEPVAFTQGAVTPIKNVVGSLFLFGSTDPDQPPPASESARLEPGKYLVKAYLDKQGRLRDDPTALLGADDFTGQVEINARWREGFPQSEKIPGRLFEQ